MPAVRHLMTSVELARYEYRAEVRKLYLEGASAEVIGQRTQRHPQAVKKLIQRFEGELQKREAKDVDNLRRMHRVKLDKLMQEYYGEYKPGSENALTVLNGVRAVLKDINTLEGTSHPVTQVIEQDVTVSGTMLLAAIAPSTGLPRDAKVIDHESY